MICFKHSRARLLDSLRGALRDESGIALPVAVVMIMLVLTLGAVAVGQATSATDGTDRDTQVKRALQAAEAGAETALARMNEHADSLNDPHSTEPRCLQSVVDSEAGVTLQRVDVDATTGWCPPSASEQIGNEEGYRYTSSGLRVRTNTGGEALGVEGTLNFGPPYLNGTIDRAVVSTGCASATGAPCDPYAPDPDDVTRRIAVQTSALDVSQLFSDYAAFSHENLVLENQSDVGSPEVVGNARSNANIFLTHPQAQIYGDATPGPTDLEGGTHSVSGKGKVHGSSVAAPNEIALPPVEMPPPEEVDGQVCSVVRELESWDHICPADSYDPATRDLNVSGGRVVLRGNTFSFCSIRVSSGNSLIWFEPTNLDAPLRIYIDSPENCGGETTSMSFQNKPTFEWGWYGATEPDPSLPGLASVTETHPDFPGQDLPNIPYPIVEFYIVGGDPPTTVSLENNNTNLMPFEIYAPRSNVTLGNLARLQGGVIANKLTMTNNTVVYPASANLPGSLSGIATLYERGLYRECPSDPAPADDPAFGCW